MPESIIENGIEYIVYDNVPIFDTEDGFNLDDLNKIVKANQLREQNTGDLPPIVLGHTSMDAPETSQPPIVGFASGFRLGKIGNIDAKDAVIATFKIFAEYASVMKNFPRRSVELWKDMVIDPIALLSSSRPRKDLGMVFKNTEKPNKYTKDNILETEMPNELVAEVLKALEDSDVFQFVRSLMEKSEEDKEMQDDEENKEEESSDEESSEEDEKEEDMQAKVEQKFALEKEELQDKFSHQLGEKNKEIESLKGLVVKTQREKDLSALAQQYNFNVDDELEFVCSLDKDQYSKHIDRIKKHYREAPINKTFNPAKMSDTGGAVVFAKKDMEEVVQYAQKNNIDYRTALKELKGR